jgi:hypothetical protein
MRFIPIVEHKGFERTACGSGTDMGTGRTIRSRFRADTRRMQRIAASCSILRDASRRFSSGAPRWVRAHSCSARSRESTWTASKRRGSPCSSSRTDTTRNARNTVRASIGETPTNRPALARPPSRRRLPAPGRWSGHPYDPVDARPRRHQADAAVPEHHGRRTSESDDRSMGKAPSAARRGPVRPLGPAATNSAKIQGDFRPSSRYQLSVICQSDL